MHQNTAIIPSTRTVTEQARIVALALPLCLSTADAASPEYLNSEEPAPASVEDVLTAIAEAVKERPRLFPRLTDIKQKLKDLPPFWRDTQLYVNPRSYYFARQRDAAPSNEAWASGGEFGYLSGYWQERLRLGGALYTTQKFYGPDDKDGTLLLKPGQQSFSVLGQAYLEGRVSDDISLKLYRQRLDLPYLNAQDNRMVPNTFEAYRLSGNLTERVYFSAAQVSQMKTRNSDKFRSMTQVAGIEGANRDLSTAGALYSVSKDRYVGAINHRVWDFMNILYSEMAWTWSLKNDFGIRMSAQYTDQRSVGDELDGNFDTSALGAEVAASYGGAIVSFAYSTIGNDSGIRNPYGGYPGYLSLMIADFDRAGEDGWLVSASFNFQRLGFPELSGFAKYASGDTPDSGPNGSPDQDEFNLTLDWRPTQGLLKGFWLRARSAWLDQQGDSARDVNDVRLILNYEIGLL